MSRLTFIRTFIVLWYLSAQVLTAQTESLYTGNDFWAKVELSTDGNENFYALHRASGHYLFQKYDTSNWSQLTSLSPTDVGLYSLGEHMAMTVSASDAIHLVFDGCTSSQASSCNLYHTEYNGVSWSAKVQLTNTAGIPTLTRLALDQHDNLHVSYVETDSSNIDHLFYTKRTAGTWSVPQNLVQSFQKSIDEIRQQWITVSSSDTVSIYYVKEDNQNLYDGNLYVRSSTDGFAAATKLIDATGQNKAYHFNDVYLDPLDRVQLNYTTFNAPRTQSYMYHSQGVAGVFTEIKVGSDALFERGKYYYVDDTLYMMVLKSNLDFGSKNLYMATKTGAGFWAVDADLGISDISANETAFKLSASKKRVILFEDSGLDTVFAVYDAPPTLTRNETLNLDEGATAVITEAAYLSAADDEAGTTSILFSVMTPPAHGQLENSDAAGTAITTFTQQNLIDGKIRYFHDDSDTTADSFDFNVSDNNNNTLSRQTFNITVNAIDDTAPAAPSTPDLVTASDSGDSDSDDLTNDATPTFSGTAEPGSTVKLYADATLIGTTTAVGGNWSITASTLSDGTYSIAATATDAALNLSASSAPLNVTIDTLKPVLTQVTAVLTPTTDTTPDYTFNTDEAGNLLVNGSCGSAAEGSVSVGDHTLTLTGTDNSSALADGTYSNCTLIVTDSAGNGSDALGVNTFEIDTSTPTGYSAAFDDGEITSAETATSTFTLSSAEVGTTYHYTISSSNGGTDVTGSGTVTVAGQQVIIAELSGLMDGTLTLSVTLKDGADNEGTAATDTTILNANNDTDNDGKIDTMESGPTGTDSGYDGNNDGTADYLQGSVQSFFVSDGQGRQGAVYITVETENDYDAATTVISETVNPSPDDLPSGVTFPMGILDFDVPVDGSGHAVIILTIPKGMTVDTYWKYTPTPDNPEAHWYEFLYDGTTGAEINGNILTLHFQDGERGDSDLSVDGHIDDQGMPGLNAIAVPWSSSAKTLLMVLFALAALLTIRRKKVLFQI